MRVPLLHLIPLVQGFANNDSLAKSSLPPVFHLACELSIALMFLNSCINQAEDFMTCEDYMKSSVSKNKSLVTLTHFCII